MLFPTRFSFPGSFKHQSAPALQHDVLSHQQPLPTSPARTSPAPQPLSALPIAPIPPAPASNMLARTALARLRAQAPRSSARDVAHISRQLAHTFLTSSTITSQLAIAPAVESFRAYATATRTKAKPKPKAKATTKKSPAKKTATRKTAAKKPVKKKAVKKTVKKKVVKKPASKRRGLTERQKMLKEKAKVRANILQLKETALEEPKKLPQSAWSLYLGEYHRNVSDGERSAPEVAKKASEAFKTISSSEMEVCFQSSAACHDSREESLWTAADAKQNSACRSRLRRIPGATRRTMPNGSARTRPSRSSKPTGPAAT